MLAPAGLQMCWPVPSLLQVLGFFPAVLSSFPSHDQPHVISAACLVTFAEVLMTSSLGLFEVSVLE